jgi:hypothetical protein
MKYVLLVSVFVLAACSSPAPLVKIETVEVKVPVVQPYPPIASISRPTLELSKLTDATSPGVVAQSYKIAVQQLLEYAQQLETLIKGVNDARQASLATP